MEPPLRQAALFRMPSRGNVAAFRVGILCGSGSCDFVVRRRAAPGDIWTGLLSVRLYPGGGSSSVIARGVGGEIEFGFEEPACGFVQGSLHGPVWSDEP